MSGETNLSGRYLLSMDAQSRQTGTSRLHYAGFGMGGNQYYLTTHSSVQKMHSSLIGPLWADAICINQEDPDERNHQVKFMGNIFRRASLVLGYVCEPSQGVRVATEVIKTVCEAVARAESESVENWEELCPSLWETSNNHQIFNSVWKNVIYLSRMPYWTR